jgi:TPR repeat protein
LAITFGLLALLLSEYHFRQIVYSFFTREPTRNIAVPLPDVQPVPQLTPEISDCDLLSGEKLNHGFGGVVFDDIKPALAISACQKQLDLFPDHSRSIHNLARAYERSGQKATAADLYLRAAKLGYSWSQNNLGVMYATGDSLPQDLDRAYAWLSTSSRQGNEQARSNLQDYDLLRFLDQRTKDRISESLAKIGIDVGLEYATLGLAVEEYKRRRNVPGRGINFLVLQVMGIVTQSEI